MKSIVLLTLFLVGSQNTYACIFDGLSLTYVADSPDFKVEELGKVNFPGKLLLSQLDQIGELPAKECSKSFIAERITEKATGQVYTAFHSNDDECDGGNSYGVLVKGTEPRPENAVATIQDSDLWCL